MGHPVQAELERIKGYIKKVKAVSLEGEKRSADEKRQLSLNAAAASRFISAALAPPANGAGGASASASHAPPATDVMEADGAGAGAGVDQDSEDARAATAAATAAAAAEASHVASGLR